MQNRREALAAEFGSAFCSDRPPIGTHLFLIFITFL